MIVLIIIGFVCVGGIFYFIGYDDGFNDGFNDGINMEKELANFIAMCHEKVEKDKKKKNKENDTKENDTRSNLSG